MILNTKTNVKQKHEWDKSPKVHFKEYFYLLKYWDAYCILKQGEKYGILSKVSNGPSVLKNYDLISKLIF